MGIQFPITPAPLVTRTISCATSSGLGANIAPKMLMDEVEARVIEFVPYEPSNEVSTFLNLRVADIDACYRDWKAKGVEFVTEPIDRVAEVRCYMRDPDGYLIEVGQATGMLEGKFAKIRPEDLPGV
jgi:hypothetical protein